MIIPLIAQARILSHILLAKSPILALLPVNITKGTTAKLNCIDKTT